MRPTKDEVKKAYDLLSDDDKKVSLLFVPLAGSVSSHTQLLSELREAKLKARKTSTEAAS